jgi:2-polyprenyl-3-methyl-5-hydroxy-6-metoxy-1,4-benzoquinol methylase
MEAAGHWDSIYTSRSTDEMSWTQESPTISVELIGPRHDRTSIIDVGAGVSTLADHLLDTGWTRIVLLDLSTEALQAVCCRLADRCAEIELITGAVLDFSTDRPLDVWHDRAVFHFLHDEDRSRYVATAARSVRRGGHLVMATFANDGPQQCSGLPTMRYSADELGSIFSPAFKLESSLRRIHVTPWGSEQPFTWVVLRRI